LRQKIKVEFGGSIKKIEGEIQGELVPISQVPMGYTMGIDSTTVGTWGP
jgi:hypothetical protein